MSRRSSTPSVIAGPFVRSLDGAAVIRGELPGRPGTAPVAPSRPGEFIPLEQPPGVVTKQHDPVAELPGTGRLEAGPDRRGRKQGFAPADEDRMDMDAVLVDQVEPGQGGAGPAYADRVEAASLRPVRSRGPEGGSA
ncbi:hypothetical protein GCM10015535_26310 [Streptomyces gelaticus]|uniref:Uncharacterized protein n=1 Tax=Streptomyces gelaticus TaxID=285446 RepID=A0ABQ2VXY3_9ACTN|nr:hypothetical protein GCM10015535_26310 [Streptomyces gelaticus]